MGVNYIQQLNAIFPSIFLLCLSEMYFSFINFRCIFSDLLHPVQNIKIIQQPWGEKWRSKVEETTPGILPYSLLSLKTPKYWTSNTTKCTKISQASLHQPQKLNRYCPAAQTESYQIVSESLCVSSCKSSHWKSLITSGSLRGEHDWLADWEPALFQPLCFCCFSPSTPSFQFFFFF